MKVFISRASCLKVPSDSVRNFQIHIFIATQQNICPFNFLNSLSTQLLIACFQLMTFFEDLKMISGKKLKPWPQCTNISKAIIENKIRIGSSCRERMRKPCESYMEVYPLQPGSSFLDSEMLKLPYVLYWISPTSHSFSWQWRCDRKTRF